MAGAVSQQHFLLTSPTGKPWDCARSRLVCRGGSGWCWEGFGIAQHLRSRSPSQGRQLGLEGGFPLWRKRGWRKAGEYHGGRASHCGQGKGTAVPRCHPVLYGTQCQPWDQCGIRGLCCHHSPPDHGLALSSGLAKSAHGGQHCPPSHPVLTSGCCIPSLTPILAGVGNGASLGSVHTRLLQVPTFGRLFELVTFHRRARNTSAELSTASPASALTALSLSSQGHRPGPFGSTLGLWGATSWAVTVPPREKTE